VEESAPSWGGRLVEDDNGLGAAVIRGIEDNRPRGEATKGRNDQSAPVSYEVDTSLMLKLKIRHVLNPGRQIEAHS
jgi:hypothetical protein